MKGKRLLTSVLAALTAMTMLASCAFSTDPAIEPSDTDVVVSESAVVSQTDAEEVKPEPTTTPVEYYGELLVDGSSIVSENTGRPTQVTGMSFFWSNWSIGFYNADYVDRMVDEFGCEVVRTAYGINGSRPHNPTDVTYIKTVIEAAIDRGIYVVVDWHAHDAHKNADEAVKFFSAIAEEYGQYDNVIFELYNEPTDVEWSEVKAYAETVTAAIREHSDNLIIVGSPTWSQDVDLAADDPMEDENTAYTLHFYAGTHKEWLRRRAEKAMDDGIALFVTEWGSCNADGNGGIDYGSTLEWVNWCNANGISMCNWAINDKAETSSVFDYHDQLTETGEFISTLISERTEQSEWLTGEPYVYSEMDY